MPSETWSSFSSILTTTTIISTILQFFSGVPVCQKIIKRRTTDDLYAFPFVFGFLLCSLWLKYGILKEESVLISVNLIGTLLSVAYCYVFMRFAVNVRSVYYQILGCIFLLMSILIYVDFADLERADALERIGYVNCTVSGTFFLASCWMVKDVFRTKSSDMLPLPLVLSSFIVSVQWYLFGYINNDNFIKVPNFFWSILAGIQLALIYTYPSRIRPIYGKEKSDIC